LILLLFKYNYKILTSHVQFGIKRRSSTDMCTFVMKETLHYVNNDSTDFCSFSDASKAFDRVHYCFVYAMTVRFHNIILLWELSWTWHAVWVMWNGMFSSFFVGLNGVQISSSGTVIKHLSKTEQNRFYLPNKVKIITKNRKYKWQATRRANCPPKLAALNIAFNLIYILTRREKDRNNQSTRCKVQVQHFTATNMSKTAVNSFKVYI